MIRWYLPVTAIKGDYNLEAYTSFAQVYDLFMDNVPYEEWSRYIIGLMKEYGICDGTVLDLGCGTGKITRLLKKAGYDMIGVDNSPEMLEIAAETGYQEMPEDEILYLLQDMRELELYGSVRAVVSICDSMNYLLEETDLLSLFYRVNEYLDPDGIFIFDLNTVYKYRELLGETTIAENREEGSFIWDNYFDEEEQINEYDLTLFIREEGKEKNLYRKYQETHYQRGYTLDEMKELIQSSGLIFETAYDAFTHEAPTEKSERIYIIAREYGKLQK